MTVVPSSTVASEIDDATATRIAGDVVADLESSADALRRRDAALAATGAGGEWLADLRRRIRASSGSSVVVPEYEVDAMRLTLEPGEGQGPPVVVATLDGSLVSSRYEGSSATAVSQSDRTPFQRTFELVLDGDRFLIVAARAGAVDAAPTPVAAPAAPVALAGYVAPHLRPVSDAVGLDFRQSSFRYTVTPSDPVAMMGAGVCWLDYDGDGWMDLFAVNSYSELDVARWKREGGLPRSAPLPQREGQVRRRRQDLARRRLAARERLRRRRLRPRRAHRPLRHVVDLRRAPLERRRRHVHGGRPRRGDRRLRLARRRGGGRRERRRAS